MGCGCGGTPSHQSLGMAPGRVGAAYFCPASSAIKGYTTRFYPTNYPVPPPTTRKPSRCFTSAQQATNAGYHLAPPPPGSLLVGGVYLVAPSRRVTRICRRSAPKAKLIVPCPRLIPGTSDSVYCAGAFPCAMPGAFVLEGSFAGPPTYKGASPGTGHLLIFAFTTRSGVWPASTLIAGTPTRKITVHGHPATFLSFPDGSGLNSGHIVLRWTQNATTYAVSLHGRTTLNQRLDRIIANHLQLDQP
jgi:hypothetical protein